jgi:tetratricopeptide (TPR) repeat protein/TolB-like protein
VIGRTLDSFRIVALLGRGGMGEVWRAEQVTLDDRPVALKLLRADRPMAGAALERLRREAATLARLRHTGIAQVHEAGEADGLYYVAMELVEGESLTSRLERGPLAPAEARRIAIAVADALAAAHDAGVLHRDVTANNIMIEPGGRVVLLDFGLALVREQSRLTTEGLVVGTTEYIAPEVLRGFEPDARSDVYSLGIVLYRALTGVFPFRGERREQVIRAATNDPLEPPSRTYPGLPVAWDAIVTKAMAREPGLRFGSARELARALEGIEAAPPMPAARSSAVTEPVPRPEGSPGVRRIAVMPFIDLTGAPAGAALADGLADAVGVALARHPAIQVVPAISTRELAREGARRIAREFGVELVLACTLQREGERLRLAASLIEAASAKPVLAESFEGSPGALRELEDGLVHAALGVLGLAPAPVHSSAATPDPIAEERLLQARGYLLHFDDEAAVDAAVRLLESITTGSGATARVWADLARSYRSKYRLTLERTWLERALEAAGRGLQLDPDSAEALAESGQAHGLLGRQGEAEREFRAALERRPDMAGVRGGFASFLLSRGRLESAEAECRSAIAVQPNTWNLYNVLGAILFERGRYEESIEAFEHVVRLMPSNNRARSNIGAAQFRLGRLDRAEQAYRDSLAVQRTAAALTGLGTVLFYRDAMAEAVQCFERAAVLRPNDEVMWGNLGAALRWQPEAGERARAAFERAVALARGQLELNPRNVEVMAALASYLASQGDLAEARRCIERALEIDPGHAHALARAATIFELAGDRAAALHALERAIVAGYGWMEFEHDRDLARLRANEEYCALKARLDVGAGVGAAVPVATVRPQEEP